MMSLLSWGSQSMNMVSLSLHWFWAMNQVWYCWEFCTDICVVYRITPQFLWVRNLGRTTVGGSGTGSPQGLEWGSGWNRRSWSLAEHLSLSLSTSSGGLSMWSLHLGYFGLLYSVMASGSWTAYMAAQRCNAPVRQGEVASPFQTKLWESWQCCICYISVGSK